VDDGEQIEMKAFYDGEEFLYRLSKRRRGESESG
jgi:hypothetical protein